MIGTKDLCREHDEELITSLLRRQIEELRLILQDLESGKSLNDYTYESLRHIQQQIHWLKAVALRSAVNQMT